MVLLSVHFPDQRADRHRGAADAEQRRDVGDRADVRLLVLLVAEDHRPRAHRLGREYRLEAAADAQFVQPLAEHVRQGAVVGLRDVGDLHLRGVGLGAGAHRADQRQRTVEGALYQRQLGREGVDGVHHEIVCGGVEQRVGLLVPDVAVVNASLIAAASSTVLPANSSLFTLKPQ